MAGKKQALDQVRFSYPKSDELTKQWLDAQENRSISMRLLIKQYIEKYGCTDVIGLRLGEE